VNSRLAHLLTMFYPRAWRERYGAEFEALLQTGRGDLRTTANVVWSALCERIIPTQGTRIDQVSRSRPFQKWCVRAPWAIFGLAPLSLLAGAYFLACFYLWSGWQIFLPGADTPFGGGPRGPIYAIENIYFQAGKFYYFAVPVLVGWGIAVMAVRQRAKVFWPSVGLILIACVGSTARVQASRTAVRGPGHISMHFALAPSLQGISDVLLHALVILSFTLVPWVIWRLQRAHSISA